MAQITVNRDEALAIEDVKESSLTMLSAENQHQVSHEVKHRLGDSVDDQF